MAKKDWLNKHAEHRGSLNEKIQSLKECKEKYNKKKES
jgi:hypothetical protein